MFSLALFTTANGCSEFASLCGGEGVYATTAGVKGTNDVAKGRPGPGGKGDGIRGARRRGHAQKKAH